MTCASPFIKPWLHACLDAEAQEDYQCAAGSLPGLEGQKQRWAAKFRRINVMDVEGMIDDIKTYWF